MDVDERATLLDAVRARRTPVIDIDTPVTDLLLERLLPGHREAIEAQMTGSAVPLYAQSDEVTRRRLLVNFAMAFGPDEPRGYLGLRYDMPPEDVHAMSRDWRVHGGDTALADLVMWTFAAGHVALPAGSTVLDFGSSSGRVTRVLAEALPDRRWLACDPNREAIAWAAEHLPGEYFVSDVDPPLPLDDASVDAVFAISVWSHFAAGAATAWLAEMARVVRPGGALLLSVHGWTTLRRGLESGTLSPGTVAAAAHDLIAGGHHFVDVFGTTGDWGVQSSGWGDAFLTLDWVLWAGQGLWAAEVDWPGALEGNQDVFVLRRR